MRRKLLFVALAVAAVAGFVSLTLPLLQPRCSRWYHTVDSVATRKVESRYGTDLYHLDKRLGHDRILEIQNQTWADAIDEVGAKPFYCN